MDLFHRMERVGPGGVKCPCCGPTATHKTKRTRLKARLRAELREAIMDMEAPEAPKRPVLDWLDRKAARIRAAFLKSGIAVSPTPDTPYSSLPPERRERWRELAITYTRIFG